MSALPYDDSTVRITPQIEYSSFYNWQPGRTLPVNSNLQMSQLDGELAVAGCTGELSLPWLGLRLGARFDMHHYARGFLDDELSAYHKALGLPNLGRENQPSDLFRGQVLDATGNVAWRTGSGGVKGGNLQVFGVVPVWSSEWEDGALGLAARAAAKFPVGSRHYGMDRGSFDWSLGAAGTARHGRFGIDVNLDWVTVGDFDFGNAVGFDAVDFAKAMLSIQFLAFDGAWAIAQVATGSSPFSTPVSLGVVSGTPVLLTFGAAVDLGGVMLMVSTAEDLSYSEVDFTFSVALEFRF